MSNQDLVVEIYLGRKNNTNYFTLWRNPQRVISSFARGNYEKDCEEMAKHFARYIVNEGISSYRIINGIQMERGKHRAMCPMMPDNGEFAFRKTLKEKLLEIKAEKE